MSRSVSQIGCGDVNVLFALFEPACCLTVQELTAVTALPRNKVTWALLRLVNGGFIERVERGCYQLTEAGIAKRQAGEIITSGPHRPHTGMRRPRKVTRRALIWRAIRTQGVGGKFTLPDLLSLASGEGDPKPDNAGRYLRYLAAAGVLRPLPKRTKPDRHGSNGLIRYQLLRDLGPEAPIYRPKTGMLWDPNAREEIPCP